MSKEIEIIRANALGYCINYFTKIVYVFCVILFLWFYMIPALNSKYMNAKSEIDQLSRQKLYNENKILIIKNKNIHNLLVEYNNFNHVKYDNLYVHRFVFLKSVIGLNDVYDMIEPVRVNYFGVTASQRKMPQNEYFIYDMKITFKSKNENDAVNIIKKINAMLPPYSSINMLKMHRCQFENVWHPNMTDGCTSADFHIALRYFAFNS